MNPVFLWGGLGLVVVLGVVGLFALSNKGKPPEKPPAPGFAQMETYRGPDAVPQSRPAPLPKKSAEELAAERRQGDESRIGVLVTRLEKEVDPATIRKEADWAKVTGLITDAEKLVGIDPKDRRAQVGGSLSQKKEAKAKADEALEMLSSNRTFSRIISEYDEALAEAASFEFFQDVRNRINSLRMRLKGI